MPALLFFFPQTGIRQHCLYLLGVIIAGTLSFSVMYLFQYRPYFTPTFLPHLETIKEMYEHQQTEQFEICRKGQLSNQALCLIFVVFDQANGMNAIQPNDKYAAVLMKLYGVDQGSLKTNLELILCSSSKKNNLTNRKLTEIRNRFAEAYLFFQKLNFTKGIDLLKKTGNEILGPRSHYRSKNKIRLKISALLFSLIFFISISVVRYR
jgi:hypothetical protein